MDVLNKIYPLDFINRNLQTFWEIWSRSTDRYV